MIENERIEEKLNEVAKSSYFIQHSKLTYSIIQNSKFTQSSFKPAYSKLNQSFIQHSYRATGIAVSVIVPV